jgi:hypothetical protein
MMFASEKGKNLIQEKIGNEIHNLDYHPDNIVFSGYSVGEGQTRTIDTFSNRKF